MNEKNSRLGLSDRLARYKDPEINKEKKAENEPRMKKTIKKTIRQNMDRRSPFPMTRSVKGLRKETMPMLPRERLMVMRSRWLQKEERLRRWDDSVKVTSNFVHKQKKKHIIHNACLCNNAFSSTSRTHHRSLYGFFTCKQGCDCDVSELGTST